MLIPNPVKETLLEGIRRDHVMGQRRLRQQALGLFLIGGCIAQFHKQRLPGRFEMPAAAVSPGAEDDETALRIAGEPVNGPGALWFGRFAGGPGGLESAGDNSNCAVELPWLGVCSFAFRRQY